jgi:tripeptide aminopeptidase
MAAEQWIERVVERAISVQQVPAPTFAESARAALVRLLFVQEGLADVQIDTVGNVLARLPGQGGAQPLVVSAHLDTVFPAGTDLTMRRDTEKVYAPGIGDNSLGVAALFALAWELKARQSSLPGDVWLVANVGEEGLGDLIGMNAVVDRFGSGVTAYLVLEGMSLGHVYHRGLGVRRYRISARTAGGHSWVDFGRPSAIHELAGVVVQLTSLPLPVEPRTSLNVGVITGGTSVNTIAALATLELDTRSEGKLELAALAAQVEKVLAQANREGVVQVTGEVIGERPAGEISASHPLVSLAVQCLQEQGIIARLNIGSTDANAPLSRGYPAVTVGLTHGAGAHTVGEFIVIQPLVLGLQQMFNLVDGTFRLPAIFRLP